MKKVLFVFLVFIAIFAMACASAETSGTCGTNLTWVLDDNGVLTISGTGPMTDFYYSQGSGYERFSSPFVAEKAIKEIIIEEGVTSIGANAFRQYSKTYDMNPIISMVHIPASVESIGNSAFAQARLLGIDIAPNSMLKTIGDYAFSNVGGCMGIKDIILPDHLEVIGNYAFRGDSNSAFKNITIQHVREIGDCAFSGLTKLYSCNIGQGLEAIGKSAFSGCTGLTEITVPATLKSIGDFAFKNCSSMVLSLPDAVETIGNNAFSGAATVRTSIYGNTGMLLGKQSIWFYDPQFPDFSFPQWHYNGYKGLTLSCRNKNATNLIIPEGVKYCGNGAFLNCSQLKEIDFPDSLLCVGNGCFNNCSQLEKIILPSGFIGTNGPGSNNIPGRFSSEGLPSLKEVCFPKSVKAIIDNNLWGSCGDHVWYKWESTGKMTISGMGEMWDEEDTESFNYVGSTDYSSWLTDVLVEEGVTSIGNRAFHQQSHLKSVILPNGIRRLGKLAFAAIGISDISIPDSVKEIGPNCFAADTYMTSLEIPYGVEKIGEYAFYNCQKLSEVKIPSSVKSIGKKAFAKSPQLSILGDLDGLTEIDSEAFTDSNITKLYASIGSNGAKLISKLGRSFCDRRYEAYELKYTFNGDEETGLDLVCADQILANIEIPYGVTRIDGGVFKNNQSLLSVSFPETLICIAEGAFQNCSNLTDLVLPSSMMEIEKDAFSGCSKLSQIAFGENLITIGQSAFSNCSSLQQIKVINPDISFGPNAFASCTNLTRAIVPGCLTNNVGSDVFTSCEKLLHFEMSGDVTKPIALQYPALYQQICSIIVDEEATTICDSAFSNCTALTEISIGGNCKSLGSSAFEGCLKLKEFNLSDEIEILGSRVFANCSSIISIDLPDSITTIGSDAFLGCNSLSEVRIPAGITEISEGMFRNCASLNSFIFPENIKTIQKNAFYGCEQLNRVQFHSDLSEVKANAFAFCENLSHIIVPGGFDGMNRSAFTDCTKLKTVSFTDSVTINFQSVYPDLYQQVETLYLLDGVETVGESAFSDLTSLRTVVAAESLQEIRREAFSGCSKLESFAFPQMLAIIGDSAFENCRSLKLVDLSGQVSNIGVNAFKNCSSVQEVFISGKPIQVEITAFEGCSQLHAITLMGNMLVEIKTIVPVVYKQINQLTISQGVKEIGASGFADCSGLLSITLPDSIELVGDSAFKDCSNVTMLTVSGSLDEIDSSAFSGCEQLKHVEIHGDLVVQLRAIYPDIYQQIEHLTLAADVNNILKSAFRGCMNLTDITIASGNNSYTFEGCALYDSERTTLVYCTNALSGSFEVPDGVKTVNNYALSNCSALESIIVPESVETIENNAFQTCNAVIITPCGSYADIWAQDHDQQVLQIHNWGAPVYTWNVNHDRVTAVRICTRNDNHRETETASAISEVTKQPTCEELGQTTYTSAAFENEYFTIQKETLADIPAIGHSWMDATYTWADDYLSVTAVRVCEHNSDHKEVETALTTSEIAVPAKCLEMGQTTYTAAFENQAFAMQTKCIENIPATGHRWGQPTYSWSEDNLQVTAKHICLNDANHTETETASVISRTKVPPTCTTSGETEYTATFINTAFASQIKTLKNIPALGHTVVVDPAIESTCTHTGLTEGEHCSVCGSVLVSQRATSKKAHTLNIIESMPSTCTEAGHEAYWQCSVCGKCFKDQSGATEITAPGTIAPHGHVWGLPTYIWAPDNGTVTGRRYCTYDSNHIDSETVPVSKTIYSPTAGGKGSYIYVSSAFQNPVFEVQYKNGDLPRLNSMNVLRLPSSLQRIEEEAFANQSCEAVIIPKTCISIGKRAFADCDKLVYVMVPEDTQVAEDAFDGCENVVVDYRDYNMPILTPTPIPTATPSPTPAPTPTPSPTATSTLQIQGADVTIWYLSSDGMINSKQTHTYPVGKHELYGPPSILYDVTEYFLEEPSVQTITVEADGKVSPNPVIFYYSSYGETTATPTPTVKPSATTIDLKNLYGKTIAQANTYLGTTLTRVDSNTYSSSGFTVTLNNGTINHILLSKFSTKYTICGIYPGMGYSKSGSVVSAQGILSSAGWSFSKSESNQYYYYTKSNHTIKMYVPYLGGGGSVSWVSYD